MKMVPMIVVALGAVGLGGVAGTATAVAQSEPMHVVTPATTKWLPGPPTLPKGVKIALIAGDPAKPGPFAFRILTPANYRIGLHTHPSAEYITIIQGSIRHGMNANKAAARVVSAGDFLYLPPKMAHALWSGDKPAVVQVNGTGPFSITYVDPKDDPRRR